jgi:hypothetical protein
MQKKKYLKILLWIFFAMLLIKLLTIVFFEPWVERKIQSSLNEKNRDYMFEIGKVHIMLISTGIKLDSILIFSKVNEIDRFQIGKIAYIKFKGINLVKAILRHNIYISSITISDCSIMDKIPFSGKAIPSIVSPLEIRIDRVFFDKLNLALQNVSNAQSFNVKEGVLKMYDLTVEKRDTLSPGSFKQFDFEAEQILSVSPDSMYSFSASKITFSAISNILAIDRFSIQPNYPNYNFTSRYKFQKVRLAAVFNSIYFYDFYAADYFRSRSLISSYVEIGKMDMKVFRDKRKEFHHVNKPAFQEMIYNYPGIIRIDSIGLKNSNITYTVHAEEANEAGSISFNKINASIYQITNDTVYKTETAFLELKSDAMLMGKGKLTILLKGRIFDSHNTFSLTGTLTDMDANELNPILEKNAFVYATSGKIDVMNFSFIANNTKATGKMIMLYHGLDITVKNKRTDDTTAIKERLISFIANRRVMDSNPIPGEDVREGKIDYVRDPERFLFHYCFRSILSGITSSLAKSPDKRNN